MTREEKTEAIADEQMERITRDPNWLREIILFGRVGLWDYTDDEIDHEYETLFEGK